VSRGPPSLSLNQSQGSTIFMNWTKLDFGKHKGKSLPQVLLQDPDWFFWAVENRVFSGQLALEAKDLQQKATHIRIPDLPDDQIAGNYVDSTGKLAGVFIDPLSGSAENCALRSRNIDLSVPRRFAEYDKTGGKIIVRAVKSYCLGGTQRRMTARRCEEFFSDDSNFNLPKKKPDVTRKRDG
jgi:hypothetical protein